VHGEGPWWPCALKPRSSAIGVPRESLHVGFTSCVALAPAIRGVCSRRWVSDLVMFVCAVHVSPALDSDPPLFQIARSEIRTETSAPRHCITVVPPRPRQVEQCDAALVLHHRFKATLGLTSNVGR
jgi:hypothetical protein